MVQWVHQHPEAIRTDDRGEDGEDVTGHVAWSLPHLNKGNFSASIATVSLFGGHLSQGCCFFLFPASVHMLRPYYLPESEMQLEG